jgi:SAM-dependent methyltransferase
MTRVVAAIGSTPLGRLLGFSAPKIVGAIDEPGPHQPYAKWLDVRGWALAMDGRSLEIVVEADGRVICPHVPRTARPDVQALFPRIRSAEPCGFSVRLESSVLPDVPRVEIVIRANVPGRPDWSQVIGSSIVSRHAHLEDGFTRTAYGQVWDAAAQSLDDARVSVCGTVDTAEWQRSGEATASDVRVEAAVQPTDVVLEIGCGAGRVGRYLAPSCARWIGGDVSANMLRFAEEGLGDHRNVSFVKLNGFDLTGIEDGSLDVVYCTGVFMHLDEWERYRYVLDGRRVLKPGGRIYVDNFNLLTDEGWAVFTELSKLDPARRPPNVSRQSTPQELEAYVARAGYERIRVRTGGLWLTVLATNPGAATDPERP